MARQDAWGIETGCKDRDEGRKPDPAGHAKLHFSYL
jgi:hypothetical protein